MVVTIVEAFVKLGLFMGYMILISRMKDIQRTFMYHGAEHKCINCVEMVSHLLWRTCLRAPDSTDAAEQAFCSWL